MHPIYMKGRIKVKNAKKHFSRALTLLLSVLFIFQSVSVPAFAAENPTENIETMVENVLVEEDSTFTLANANVQISDEYGNETDYISEVQIPDIEQSTETNVEDGIAVVTDYPGDDMVYLTQRWLNQEYGHVAGFGSVPENGKTGWDTVYGLTRALQIELGITSLANNFGPTTQRLYGQNPLQRQDGVTNRKFAILQGALWCKGYCPGYNLYEAADGTIVFNGVFDADVEEAVIELKTDAGFINPNGVVTVNVMKALMTMDTFKLLSSYGGTAAVREMQQKLNRKYEAYTGITPCDGVYGRNTNKALIYALQAEEGLPTSVANGNFGNTTKLCCPEIPYIKNSTAARRYPGTSSGSYYSASQIASITELLQFALLVNGFDVGEIDGVFGPATQQALRAFQKKMSIPQTGKADKTTWLSLFVSCGDTSRSAKAADCATILTAAKAKTLYDNGYRYIGRYLTGTYNGGISKAITRAEAQIIFDAGLNFFPIYQTSANSNSYFTSAQGTKDAKAAITAAASLGIPANTIIYFAVDYDCLDYQITSNVIPYFKSVHEVMSNSIYRTGIYGTRNACTRVSEKGYACSSFVGDMSTGFSGNLGFSMPDNWAFDQFYTTSIGSGNGYLEIDKDGFSGRDYGVSRLEPIESNVEMPDITFGESFSDELVGPMLNILGYEAPSFKLPFGFSISPSNLIEYEDSLKEGTRKVTIGLGNLNHGEDDPYDQIKELVESFDKSPSTASWNSLKGIINNVKKLDFKMGFDMSGTLLGFIEYDLITGEVKDSGLVIIADASVSARAPVYPLLFLKFQVEGNITGTNIKFVLTDAGKIGVDGSLEFSVKLKAGLEADIFIANAYAGVSGGLNCELGELLDVRNSFNVYADFTLFIEAGVLFWGGSSEWTFASFPIYPTSSRSQPQVYSLTKDDLEFIEPINRVSTFSIDPDVFLSNVQTYCSPRIVDLGGNKMMLLYIDDVASRSAENRTTLMYSIFDGSQWSSPLPVHNDGTTDFAPEVCSDGNGGVHIVWQNAKTLFDNDVTLDEMTPNMELYYAHWNGSAFDNIASLTNNNTYESKHVITCTENNISVVWLENSENDPFGLAGTNQICRKQFCNESWGSMETIVTGLNPVNSIDTSYVGANNVIAYTAKTNADTASMEDLEVFYYDGTITRITNDIVADCSVTFCDDELYWISDKSVVFVTDGDVETRSTAIAQIPNSVTKVNVLKNVNGQKTIVWSQDDEAGTKIYGANYNQSTSEFGIAAPLSEGNGVIRGWDAMMMSDGKIQLSYCAAEMLEESVDGRPYGQLDLYQKTADEFADISVSKMITYDGEVEPNGNIMISVDVHNNGSKDLSRFDVEIMAPDGSVVQTNTIDKDLPMGSSGTVNLSFNLPSEISKTQYNLKITPHGTEDIFLSDNQSAFVVGYADLAIQKIEEQRTENGRTLLITVMNQGYEPADGTLKVVDANNNQQVFSSNISQLNHGETVELIYEIDESGLDAVFSEDPLRFNLKIESGKEEFNYINNARIAYVYPDYSINVVSGSNGTVSGMGDYIYNSTATVTATPASGYIFAGWYENDKLLDGLSEEYSFTVFSNRTLEARFIPNNLSITNIEVFGDTKSESTLTFTATSEGGNQPYQWEFYIYKGEEVCYSSNTLLNFFEWTPTEPGSYLVVANATDVSGFEVSYNKQFIIE